MMMMCAHCGQERAMRARGLGWRCHTNRSIRVLYPVVVWLELGTSNHARPLPADPTDARPGSEEKMAVLAARAAREERLYHPGDARL